MRTITFGTTLVISRQFSVNFGFLRRKLQANFIQQGCKFFWRMIFPNFFRFSRPMSSIFPLHFCAKLNILGADSEHHFWKRP